MGSSALSAPELTARSVGRLYCEHSNMFKFVISSCLAAAALSQFVDPEKAKILKEQRFNAGDGRFGAAYAQEDGTVYREETTADGERVGQYSYIDQAGKTITVRYTAGKDGFRILEDDHVPTGANGQGSAQFQATPRPAPAPRQQFVQQQQPQQPQQQQFVQPRESVDYDYEYYDGAVPETSPRFNQQSQQAPAQQTFVPAQPVQRVAQPQQPVRRPVAPANSNPFINPHDPTHRNFNFNRNGGNFGGRTHQASAVPPCADCAGVNPFVNPFDASHRNPASFAPAPTAAPRQQFQQTFQQPQQFAAPAVTEAPRNFFPPGQLQLNRFENGFNFDFTSQ